MERSAARKTEGHVIFADHEIAECAVPFKNGQAPGIDGFTRLGDSFAHERANGVSELLKTWIFLFDISVDSGGGFYVFGHQCGPGYRNAFILWCEEYLKRLRKYASFKWIRREAGEWGSRDFWKLYFVDVKA